ncbi:MAG TPA: HlyD family efflux transporter periplasmic adaptor subunit [Candidatus Acidoferrales bacterium]|nr:HlyD family efflux transporter periplasmic adaptor subunit [Candidatus Acidoferrales bacterium]
MKILALAIVALAAIAMTLAHYRGSSASISSGEATIAAASKDFVATLRLTGTTGARRARSIMVPTLEGASLGSLVVTKLAPAGAHVKQGDLLVEFDQQAQIKDYLDKKATYMDFEAQVAVKQAAEDAARAQDETALKQAEDDLTKAQLEVSKNELVSRIDAEKNQETLEEAQSTLRQLQETFKLKRQAAAADIRTLEIQRDRAMATMNYAQSNAQKMTVRSPMEGVTVLNTVWLGGRMGEVQEGDQVRAGVPFMQVVDPSEMLVHANVNEADLLKLQEGQKAVVSFDAYPGLTFPATLTELSPLGRTGQFSDKVRTFAATFAIHGSNLKLMPDLSAAVDIELSEVKNATVIPLQSIGREKDGDFVWLKTGMGFEKRAVKLGPQNDLNAVVESGLKPGDEIREEVSDGSDAAAVAEASRGQ